MWSLVAKLGLLPDVRARALALPFATITPPIRAYGCRGYFENVPKHQNSNWFLHSVKIDKVTGIRSLSSETESREKRMKNMHKRRLEKENIDKSLSEWETSFDAAEFDDEYDLYNSTSGNLDARSRSKDNNVLKKKKEKQLKLSSKTWNKFFGELDPTTRYDVEGSSEKSQKAQAISRTRRLTGHLKENTAKFGKPMTHRQQRAADELYGELSNVFYRRQFHSLDLVVSKALGDPMGAPIEVVDVRLTRDLQIVTIYWEPPLLPDGFELSKKSILMIEEELQHIKGKLRTLVAHRLGFRRAPQIRIVRGFTSSDQDSKQMDKLFFDIKDS
mmetsp:Transcript_5740/g.6572  ORF Transcript_5740/g.6572 Transcript_5740/m.6572 type:complete len:330 (+) Transcript_5740:705-1694(+)